LLVKLASQHVLGMPKLGQDFARLQVSAKSLMPRRAKAATHGASRLGRNTQGAPIALRNEHAFNQIAITDVEKPLDGAVGRSLGRYDRHGLHMGMSSQLVTQRPGQIGHLREITDPALMDPAKQLCGTKTLFPQLIAKISQRSQIKAKKVGGHCAGTVGSCQA